MPSRSPLWLGCVACAAASSLAAQAPAPRWDLRVLSRFPIASSRAAVARDGGVFVPTDGAVLRYAPGAPAPPRRLPLATASRADRIGVRGDTLVVYGADGATLLAMGGAVLRTHAMRRQPSGPGVEAGAPEALLGDGSVLASPRFDVEMVARGAITDVPIVRTDAAGVEQGVLARRSLRHFGMRILGAHGQVIATRQPWHDEELVAAPGDGGWVAVVSRSVPEAGRAGEFRVTRFGPAGGRVWERRYPAAARVLPGPAVARMARLYAEGFLAGDPAPQALRAVRDALWLPRALPPVTAAVAARDGTLWLRREAAVEDAPSVRWTVLDASGNPVGEFSVPGTWMIVDADGPHVWAVERDMRGAGALLHLRREGARR